MNRPLAQRAPRVLLAQMLVSLAVYELLRVQTGSATEALALTSAIPAGLLVVGAITRRRVERIGVISTVTVAIALAVYALTGGDPIALKLQHGAFTGLLGVAALASLALGRPLLVLAVERRARLDPERRAEIEARLADPDRRRALVVLTLLIGLAFTLDGVVQTALAFTVSTGAFVADSTVAHLAVLGGGAAAVLWYFRYQKQRREPDPG